MHNSLDTRLERLGVSVEDMSNLTGIPEDTIQNAIAGHQEPPKRMLALLTLLGYSPSKARARAVATARLGQVWRTIPGFSAYQASKHGEIRRGKGGKRVIAGRVLKTKTTPQGYLCINIYDEDGKQRSRHVHRLVCLAFHGEPTRPNNLACHKNSIKADCRAENLYWGSHLDNSRDYWNVVEQIITSVSLVCAKSVHREVSEGRLTTQQAKKMYRKQMDERLRKMAAAR